MRTRRPSSPETRPPANRLLPGDGRFPRALLDLQQFAPTQLWVRGSLEALHAEPMVAVVGTRRASAYGLRVTRELSSALARAGACVISGMAVGIDAAAHRAALEHDSPTVAVLGTGLDVVYPRAHRELHGAVASRGALVSEMEPLDHGTRWTFPRRNRIIAALARLVVVVEAPERSGALITAGQALDLGRTVAAVPGPIDQPLCVGSNRLLRDGAITLTSADDALALIGLSAPPRVPRGSPEGDEGRVWAALADGALDVDSLCARSGLPAHRCLSAVTTLELAGSIECAMTGEIRRR